MPTLHERLHARFIRSGADIRATEQDIASILVVYSFISLLAIYIDRTEPDRFANLAYGLLIAYVLYSLGLLIYISRARKIGTRTQVVSHILNICWAVVISLFTNGPNSAFFLFFVFVIFSAAYRWHFKQTLLTTVTLVIMLLLQAVIFRFGPGEFTAGAQLEINRLIMRAVYLAMMGVLAGYVAEKLKRATAELALLTRFTSDINAEGSLKRTMTLVAQHLNNVFGRERVILAFNEVTNGEMFVVEYPPVSPSGEWRKATEREQQCLFFARPFRAAVLLRNRTSSFLTEDSVTSSDEDVSPGIWDYFHVDSILALHLILANEWDIRVFIPDPIDSSTSVLNLLDMVNVQLQPALSNVYLLRRIRNQATAMERARIARDLHDGSIQSLVSLEMQMAMLADSARTPEWLKEELDRLKDVVRGEVLGLREMMERMHPVNVSARNLVQSLSDVVEDFRRRTAINIHFVSEAERVNLRPRVCQELISILREALVNVRKHSGANTVVVRLACDKDTWRLQVDDDGCGFDFTGDMYLNDLDRERRGPVVIKERVRVIGGQLKIQSVPGKGAQLEVTVGPSA